MGANYRSFEDKHGLLKFYVSIDREYEAVLKGLSALKGSTRWDQRAKDLEEQFIRAFDGLVSHRLPPRMVEGEAMPESQCLYDEFINALREDFYFLPCDQLTFRKIHDDCIRLFKEVGEVYSSLVKDDRSDILGRTR